METNVCIQFSTILGMSIAGSIIGIKMAAQQAFAKDNDGARKPIVCITCEGFVCSMNLKQLRQTN
jgi:hypothetical protein